MPKNIWEAKISYGFPSLGTPSMLLLASVSTGISPACAQVAHKASSKHQQGQTGRGAQPQHRVRIALGTMLSSTHGKGLPFFL